jgi:hypothetical protein
MTEKRSRVDEELAQLITCSICKEFMFNEIYQCKIGHLYCKTCIHKIDKCSICKTNIDDKTIRSLPTEHLRDQLPLPCSNEECKIITQQHKKHKEECKFNKCANFGCDFKNTEEQLKYHSYICSYRTDECVFQGCDEQLLFIDMKKHYMLKHNVRFKKINLGKPERIHITKGKDEDIYYELNNDDFMSICIKYSGDRMTSHISMVSSSSYEVTNTFRHKTEIIGSFIVLPTSPDIMNKKFIYARDIDFDSKSDEIGYYEQFEMTLLVDEY